MKSRIHLSEHFTYSKLLMFTLPSIVMNVFLSLYIVVDGYFVANFTGKTEFAAVNLIMPVLNILGTIGYMFGVGGSALIAKTLGEKNHEQANRMFSLIVLVSSCLGILMTVSGFIFMGQITAMLGAEGKLLENSVLYGRIFILALPAWILAYEFQLFFVTAEKPGLGLAVTVCAGLCNILLDAIFIIVFKWGIVGAALASALSQIVGGVFPLMYFICKNNSLLKLVKPAWDGKALFRCITNGSSEFMAEAAASFVGIIYNVQLLKYVGEDGVVIYGMLMYVSLIFSAMFVGYSNGIGPVISYHFGAQDHRELKNLRKRSLMIIGLSSVSMFVLSEILAHPFSAMFLQGTEKLLPYAVHAFRIVSVAYLFTGMAIFGSAFFTALNNGQVSALISFMRNFVFELGAVILLPILFGIDGIWYSVVFA
ncbi:MAG: MATE family efflux transporter, partial [Lachnospiraceae bacterium]|nr:MATE family efflux transporter [Lachnospiraceae bacterium]